MRLKGEKILRSDIEMVWAALNDPEHLEKAIPGCRNFQQIREDCFTVIVSLGMGPIKGEYSGEMEVTDKCPPKSYAVRFSGSSQRGFVRVESHVELAECEVNKTEVKWKSEAEVGGKLVAAGDRVLISLAEALLKQFFKRLETQLMTSHVELAEEAEGKPVDSSDRLLTSNIKSLLKRFFNWLKTPLKR